MPMHSELEELQQENELLRKRIAELEKKEALSVQSDKPDYQMDEQIPEVVKKINEYSRHEEIRNKAMRIIEGKEKSADVSLQALKELVHELDVYREELEVQNEELIKTYSELLSVSKKYSEIFNSAPVGYFIVDNLGVIEDVNKTAIQMLSANRDKLLKKNLAVFIRENSRKTFFDFFKQLFRSRGLGECEVELVDVNGNGFFGEMQGLLVKDEKTQRTQFRIILHDITTRKEAERDAELHSQRLNLALWAAGLAWWDWHYPSGKVSASQRKKQLLGYDVDEYTDIEDTVDSWIGRIHPEDYNEAMDKMRRHLRGESPIYEISYRLQTKDGGWKWMRDRGRVVERDEDGAPLRISGAVQDIQENVKKEQERERLFNYSVDMFSIIDYDGAIQQVNPAWAKTLGWSELALLGKNIFDIVHADDMHDAKDFFEQLKAGKTIRNFTVRVETKEGEYRYLSWNSYLLIEDRKFFSVTRDVTENIYQQIELDKHREHLEELVKERTQELKIVNERLYDANASKDRFFSIISHDLKNPFQVLLGLSDLMLMRFDSLDTEKKKYYLQEIKKTTNKTHQLLENLLLWSRAQTGKLQIEPERVNLKDVLNDVLSISNPAAHAKNITLTETIEEDYYVEADQNMLLTVFRNLISNAIKFTPSEGEVTVSVMSSNNLHTVKVIDTGIGIPDEDKGKLFKIDKTVSREGTNNETGTGLGLILCKEFVEKNNGTITVESTESEGSKFIVTLPVIS